MQQLNPYFSREALSQMNPEELDFAKHQLHRLLSKELSKVSASISKKQKINNNLNDIRLKQQQQINLKIAHLNKKFEKTQEKRKKVLQDKIAQCILHDKKIQQKITERYLKTMQQQREAAKKSRTYSVDLQNYLKQKELQQSQFQQKMKHEFINRSKIQKLHTQQLQLQKTPIRKQRNSISMRISNKPIQNNLDKSIKIHQRRAQMQQQETVSNTFQKILKKMDLTNQKLLKFQKQKSKKQANNVNQRMYRFQESYENNEDKVEERSRKWQPRTQKLQDNSKKTIDYLSVKRQKQLKQFQQRGQLYQKIKQKNRKEQIRRHLKNKVKEHGISLLNQIK